MESWATCTCRTFYRRKNPVPEAMDQCEYACLMPGGVLDLYCYEDCIYSIC
jgi:hypothetical protein